MSTTTTNYKLIKPELSDPANITAFNENWDKIDQALKDGVNHMVTAQSTDGVTYAATVDGVTELYTGLTITIIPNMTSTSNQVELNVNELGAKSVRLTLPTDSGNSGAVPKTTTWLVADAPVTVRYDLKTNVWKTDLQVPSSHSHAASDITAGALGGRVMANAAASENLGNAQVRNINAGTNDLTAGTSSLGTGSVYLVYE